MLYRFFKLIKIFLSDNFCVEEGVVKLSCLYCWGLCNLYYFCGKYFGNMYYYINMFVIFDLDVFRGSNLKCGENFLDYGVYAVLFIMVREVRLFFVYIKG